MAAFSGDDQLMKSISGIRGIVGEGLVPPAVLKYVTTFVALQKERLADGQPHTLVLGRDSRVSGSWLAPFVGGLLVSLGVDVLDVGIVPTPTVQYLVEQERATLGGIVVTSSHNPIEWNGLKFVDADGQFLAPALCERLYAAPLPAAPYVDYRRQGALRSSSDGGERHIEALLRLDYVDVAQIAARQFKVALDTVNGAGGPVMVRLLQRLGCQPFAINTEPNGLFAHPPEPIGDHLDQLRQHVIATSADLGIAVDPDVDRCVLVDERGQLIGEEYTLALAVEFLLGRCGKRGPVCKNLSSSRAVDDIAAKYNCPVHATPVGEIHVAKKMEQVGAVIGGEGNGGVMLPDVHIGRDALVATVLTLQHLAVAGTTLSQLKATLPQYDIAKLKAPLPAAAQPERILEKIRSDWQHRATIDEQDGLHISTPEFWVHLRRSNTEPIIRVIGEGGDIHQSTQRCEVFLRQITEAF